MTTPEAAQKPETDELSLARANALKRHLDIRYSKEKKPYTSYPYRLTRYLTDTYLSEYKSKKLLDLGCGRGEFLNGFAKVGFEAIGLDSSKLSDHPFPEPIVIHDIEGQRLPFDDNSFDVVFHKSVIEHIHNTDVFLAENLRILKPGGLMVCMAPDWRSQWSHFYDDYTHVKPFTLKGLRYALEFHQFEVVDSRRFRQLPFLWKFPFLHPVCDGMTWLPDFLKERSKLVRFSKEWMLLVVGRKK
jgi:SAM-dependent methyltransferase